MDDDSIEKFLREIDEENQLKRKRKGHTYVEDLLSRSIFPGRCATTRNASHRCRAA